MSRWAEGLSLDLRSLAILRMGLAAVMVGDLWFRSWSLRAHYTDFGLLPRDILLSSFSHPSRVSLHLMSGETWAQALLFIVAALASLAFGLGWRTRVSGFVSWAMLLSLHNRNPMVLQGGDVLIREVAFWGMFLPLGARWSLDARRAKSRPAGAVAPLVPSLAYTFQIVCMYVFTTIMKSAPEWREQGTAVYYALQLDQLVTPWGVWLRHQLWLMPLLTDLVLAFEAFGTYLLFVPGRFGPWLRLATVAAFAFMHFCFGFFIELGPFPWICIVAWLAFIPTTVWDEAARRWPRWLAWSAPLRPAPRAVATRAGMWRGRAWAALRAAFLSLCCGYALAWNFGAIQKPFPTLPGQPALPIALGLDQSWGMFSPSPPREDGWYVAPGTLADGRVVDVLNFREGEPRWEKPAVLSRVYPTERWRKYMMNIMMADNAAYREPFGKYLCRAWNEHRTGADRLHRYKIYVVIEPTSFAEDNPATRTDLIYEHLCFIDPPAGAK